ncbi:MAG: thioredoxin [Oscillospiraceae bacterium]|nr:thioredoxin [Oscillospiraceae bacterium]
MEITLTAENFEKEVLNSQKCVLVDFWATWCGPCRMIAPIIEEIAEEYADSIKVGKVNVDEQGAIAAAYNIDSIPTIIVFENGKIKNKAVGYRTKEQLEALL